MASTARSIEAEVFELERIRIVISAVPDNHVFKQSYRDLFSQPLPDSATLDELCMRVSLLLGTVTYGVINPLGSPARISHHCLVGSLRAYYAPMPERSRWRRWQAWLRLHLGARVARQLKKLGRVS